MWNTSRSRGDSGEVKLAEKMIVLGHGSLTFVDLDGDGWLIVTVSGKGLGLLGGDGSVPLDQACLKQSQFLERVEQHPKEGGQKQLQMCLQQG